MLKSDLTLSTIKLTGLRCMSKREKNADDTFRNYEVISLTVFLDQVLA